VQCVRTGTGALTGLWLKDGVQ